MARSISVKDAELFELLRGNALAGGDNSAFLKEAVAVLREKAVAGIGKDIDIAYAASEKEIQLKMSELKERAAVLQKLRTKK